MAKKAIRIRAREMSSMDKGAGKTPKRRRGLQGLLVGVLLLSFVLPAYLLLSSYCAQMRAAEDSTRNLVAMLRVQFNDALRRTEAKLDAMASKLSREAATQQALSECQFDIGVNHNHVNCVDGEGRGTGLFLNQVFGVAVYSSEHIAPQVLSSVGRDYFAALRDDHSVVLHFASATTNLSSGEDVLLVARAVRGAEGQFVAALLSVLDLAVYAEQLASLPIGNSGFVTLRRRDSHQLVQSWPVIRDETTSPDHSLANMPITKTTGTFSGMANYIASWSLLPDYPLYLVAGLDRPSVLADWNSQTVVASVALAVLIGLGGLLLIRLGRMDGSECFKRTPNDERTDVIVKDETKDDLAEAAPARVDTNANTSQVRGGDLRFLSVVGHDLRQPIQAINLFLDAFVRMGLNEEQKKIVHSLSQSVRSLSAMQLSLLDLLKLDADLIQPKIEKVEVDDIFKTVDDEFSALAQQKNLRFKFFYPFQSPLLKTDAALLLKVLRHLLDNALNNTLSGGVLVGVRVRGKFGLIQVWDTGSGIDTAIGGSIFEGRFQAETRARRSATGLGIGLSIARRMARLIGGELTYRSKLGKGSVFEITVPLDEGLSELPRGGNVEGNTSAVEIVERDPSRFANWRVVVVEDDPVLAMSIQLSLESTGIGVQLFSSAEAALASPTVLGADFYISDFILPGMSGAEMLGLIQSRSSRPINALLMTGEADSDRICRMQKLGWRVLQKPAGLDSLLATMRDIVDAREASQTVVAKGLDQRKG